MKFPFNLTPAQKCYIGTILMKAASSLTITWGKTNIYYYSYYRHLQEDLPIAYNTVPIAIIAIPLALVSLFSMKLAKRFGHSTLIRICAFFQMISLLVCSYMPTYLLFILFYLVIPSFCFAATVYPILGCVWSHYPKKEGQVTGVVLGALSFATLLVILLITLLSNPNNMEADLDAHMGKQSYKYFSYEVGRNVPHAVFIVSFMSAISLIIGSMLITMNDTPLVGNPQELIDEEIKPKQQISIEMVIMDEAPEKVDGESPQIVPLLLTYIFYKREKKLNDNKELFIAIKSQQFRIIFLAQFSLFFFVITLGINFKSYALSKFNNDYFVTFVDTLALILQGLLSVVWGIVTDKVNFVNLFTALYFISGSLVIMLALTSGQVFFTICINTMKSLVYLSVSLFDKGSMVVTGPGLVRIFGNDIGTQLLPIINVGALMSLLISPLLQMALMNFMDFDYMLALCGVFILIASYFNSQLMMEYQRKE